MSEKIEVWSFVEGKLIPSETMALSEEEWKKKLPEEVFRVARQEGTERAFSGASWNEHRAGMYRCAACGLDLFPSTRKYDSGTGWPSFSEPVHPSNIETRSDRKLFAERTEVHCRRCGAHLGHVFPDGPKPTGLRYCLNSVVLAFDPAPEGEK